ncbi:SSU rRNA (adenine(1518)-N(6)/adenine(1519)-N(6))-dimethyltransferase [hydrothermal vent metagenome]|uniref:SSU rRNA (Adenine(1518)-N(6)/adenine(1519)-N(6))-dimethyltransferase n=1 Tax=hydrothermal vent metagenome TaxID=652676 RepID=A0A3B1B8E0_9ZZZZ
MNTDNYKARKRFGQNFLTDESIIQNIIHSIYPKSEQTIIEIGPGLGAITVPLLKLNQTLTVIELDRDIIPKLQENCKTSGELNIIQADVLTVKLNELELDKKQDIRIIGNLPYNISTPILFHLMSQLSLIKDMHFMLQKEVVDRMAAPPGSKTYGRLSVMLQYFCKIESLFTIPPEAFSPAPKVTSALVRLTPYKKLPVEVLNIKDFSQLVTSAFSQRRKTLRNSIKKLLDSTQIEHCNIKPTIRPEQLSINDFAVLSNCYTNNRTT